MATLLAPAPAKAQSTAALAGWITDQAGAVAEGVHVRLIEQGTGLARETSTNGRGLFLFANLSPGVYVVEASRTGFSPVRTEPLELYVNGRREIRMTLEASHAAPADVTVEVASSRSRPLGATVVNERFVSLLPLNGRSFQNLIAMTPGVVQTPAATESWGQLSLAGQRNTSNYFTVDGVSANFGLPISYDGSSPAADGVLPSLSAMGNTNGLVAVDALRRCG